MSRESGYGWQSTRDARRLGIGRKPECARAWIRRNVPDLSVRYYQAKHKVRLDHDSFNGELEWPKWQVHLNALQWLAEARTLPSKPRTEAHRIPLWVQRVVDQVLERTRNALLSDWITEGRLSIRLSGSFSASQRFSSPKHCLGVVATAVASHFPLRQG